MAIIWSSNDPPQAIEVDDDVPEWLPKRKWKVHTNGYVTAGIDYKQQVGIHRVIMGVDDPTILVDHKDRNKLNNKRDNLRIATPSQSIRNRGLNKDNKSGYKWVHKCPRTAYWIADVTIDGKRYLLGNYESPEEAALVADAKIHAEFGEFAQLNFPDKLGQPLPADKRKQRRGKYACVFYCNRKGRRKRWRVTLGRTPSQINLGFYETEEEAALVVLDYVLKHFPEKLNTSKFQSLNQLAPKLQGVKDAT